MGLFNIKHLQNELESSFNGKGSTVYTKIYHLMNGYRGNSTKKEIQCLRNLLKKEFAEVDGILKELEQNN